MSTLPRALFAAVSILPLAACGATPASNDTPHDAGADAHLPVGDSGASATDGGAPGPDGTVLI